MAARDTSIRTPGVELEVERVRAGVLVKHVAEFMGISDSRVSRIEDDPAVTARLARRYRLALAEATAKYGTSRTSRGDRGVAAA